MKADERVTEKIEEKKIQNYIGRPNQTKEEFLQAKTFQQAIQDYKEKRQNDKKFKNMLNTDEKLQYITNYSQDFKNKRKQVKLGGHIPYP